MSSCLTCQSFPALESSWRLIDVGYQSQLAGSRAKVCFRKEDKQPRSSN
jgi:hypothetical protein